MTAKEKAEQLVKRFEILLNYDLVSDSRWHNPNCEERNRLVLKDAKLCAMNTVDIIMALNDKCLFMQTGKCDNNHLQEVKSEIQKL